MRLTLIQPAIGKRARGAYIRGWQIESLSAATLAGLTPPGVEVRFYDDRLEPIPYDEPTDLVAISLETYAARRAYQIASEFRRRRVPVVLGGFHPTLCPEEAARYAEAVVVGEAEEVWPRLLDDFGRGRLEKLYRSRARPSLEGLKPDRSIFRGRRYLPLALVETARGCPNGCEFCAVQSAFHATQTFRPVDEVVAEVAALRGGKRLFFFVNDNFSGDLERAKELCRALIPLKIRWVSQASVQAALDEELLDLMARSGCVLLLMGLESLNPESLRRMRKPFNRTGEGLERALADLRRHRIHLYGTFMFGYDDDAPRDFADAVDFAIGQGMFVAAFAHLMPFPGTPLYARLQGEKRLLYDAWWLDPDYRFNMIPFRPLSMEPERLEALCLDARRRFYSWSSVARRSLPALATLDPLLVSNYCFLNALQRADVGERHRYPLGDERWTGTLLPA